MIKVYGITTCGSVKKALKFFKDSAKEVEFVDLKKVQITPEKLDYWIAKSSLEILFNKKGTKYKTLGLKDKNLNDYGVKEWLLKEQLLFKRPIIEYKDQVIVGFDEEQYSKAFK